ncbi:hypothetical protein ABZ771_23050 [Streptomyces globisporus]|uniref:hypothetical protein n=1 Tax=Streptomyces TaxID=1883 RepID=UPI0004CB83D0|nr:MULTISPECIES: hypothetical protein [Streptomyces]PPA44230.1 hypothetical protein BF14_005885 [Streptomyces griseus]WSF75862.1 hypothetical protein OG838_06660 [Streptomyces globisporus]WSQ90953.1 hypothetical protein OG425_05830 [Streptomyces globisporus]WSV88952.1 hypothetical protein OG449_06135 [Streptomyces globisporus]
MADRREDAHAAEDDDGCLRRVMAVPLGILYLLAAGLCYSAWTIRPSGTWDEDAYGAVTLFCLLAIVVSVIALVITAAPPTVRRAMGLRWLAPPMILAAIAATRWVLRG